MCNKKRKDWFGDTGMQPKNYIIKEPKLVTHYDYIDDNDEQVRKIACGREIDDVIKTTKENNVDCPKCIAKLRDMLLSKIIFGSQNYNVVCEGHLKQLEYYNEKLNKN